MNALLRSALLSTFLVLPPAIMPRAGAAPSGESPAPLRVMLLSGANNHNWKLTTPELCAILGECGRFRVDVVDDVATLKAPDFAPYDVIVSNYNTFKKPLPADQVWSAPVREAFLDHIRGGRGFVVVHAGSSSLYDWPEYQNLSITSWTLKVTRHGKLHAARVTFDGAGAEHPVTRGLAPFWTYDEYWENLVVQPGATALAKVHTNANFNSSGNAAPILFARNYGKGRSLCLLLGHNVPAMGNPGFRTLLKRGAEWAATGKVTIPADKNWPGSEASAMAAAEAGNGSPAKKQEPASKESAAALKTYLNQH